MLGDDPISLGCSKIWPSSKLRHQLARLKLEERRSSDTLRLVLLASRLTLKPERSQGSCEGNSRRLALRIVWD